MMLLYLQRLRAGSPASALRFHLGFFTASPPDSRSFHGSYIMRRIYPAAIRCGLICRNSNASLKGCQLTWPPFPAPLLSPPSLLLSLPLPLPLLFLFLFLLQPQASLTLPPCSPFAFLCHLPTWLGSLCIQWSLPMGNGMKRESLHQSLAAAGPSILRHPGNCGF